MYNTNPKEVCIINGNSLKKSKASEKINKAIDEMYINRKKRISKDNLIKLIVKCNH